MRGSTRSVMAVKPSMSVNSAVISRISPSSRRQLGLRDQPAHDLRRQVLLEAPAHGGLAPLAGRRRQEARRREAGDDDRGDEERIDEQLLPPQQNRGAHEPTAIANAAATRLPISGDRT